MFSTLVEPTDWALEISPATQAAIWQQHRAETAHWGSWNAYLNQLCLETILPWLQDEYLPTATAGVDSSLMSLVWDVVTGGIITVGTKRIALMPTESIDRATLEVPQEWVDIDSWVADYYLGVQISSDEREIQIYGYATHHQIKMQGSFDPLDRTYALDCEDLNPDLNALWLTLDRYPATVTRAAVAPILTLATVGEASPLENRIAPLIDRLGDRSELLPRLAVPFEIWAAIIENPTSLQRLYQHRHNTISTTVFTRLSGWLQGQIDAAWQTLDLVLLPPQIATAVRSADRSIPAPSELYRAKVYTLATGQIALVIGISPVNDTESRIGLQIHPAGGATQLPGSTRLRLLTVAGDEIGQASATVTETIQFQFRANAGERFQIEIACGGETQTESFEL